MNEIDYEKLIRLLQPGANQAAREEVRRLLDVSHRWTKDDQRILAGLSNRAADAKEEGQDTIKVAPEDIEWAVEWLCDLIHGRN